MRRINFSKLTGGEYLFLSLVDDGNVFTKQQITKLSRLSRPAISYTIENLLAGNYIKVVKNRKTDNTLYKTNSYFRIEDRFSKAYKRGLSGAINGSISYVEFKILVCLIKNLSLSQNVTYTDISYDCKIDKSDISRYIKALDNANIIKVEKVKNRNAWQNEYSL